MSKQISYDIIFSFLSEYKKGLVREELTDDLHIKDHIGLNSFQIVDLIGQIEDRFDIDIPDRKLRELQTVGQISKFLQATVQ